MFGDTGQIRASLTMVFVDNANRPQSCNHRPEEAFTVYREITCSHRSFAGFNHHIQILDSNT